MLVCGNGGRRGSISTSLSMVVIVRENTFSKGSNRLLTIF
jgi:hypothetical protein